MSIIGIIVILAMPYMAGYILTKILNIKETSQIETYLTGFFFVFLIQGIVYSAGYFVLRLSFLRLCQVYSAVLAIVLILFMLMAAYGLIKRLKASQSTYTYHSPMQKDERILLTISLLIAIAVIAKIVLLKDYLRKDLILATVRTIISTDTIYEYNPITSVPFTLGLIGSKKIISLPVYYACLCRIFGLDSINLLYIVLTLQTILCTYFACVLFISPVLRNRRKVLIFACFLGALILSGDYFSGSICTKLCWNGYSGDAIVPCVIIPYTMYLVTDWYRKIRDTEYNMSVKAITSYVIRMMICIIASVFITGITTGILLIILNTIILVISCIVRFKKEGRV